MTVLVAILNGVDGPIAVLMELNKEDSDGRVISVLVNGEKRTKVVKPDPIPAISNNVTTSTTSNNLTSLATSKTPSKSLTSKSLLTTEFNNLDGMFTTVEELMTVCTPSVELLMF
jgi:hypothetical protein